MTPSCCDAGQIRLISNVFLAVGSDSRQNHNEMSRDVQSFNTSRHSQWLRPYVPLCRGETALSHITWHWTVTSKCCYHLLQDIVWHYICHRGPIHPSIPEYLITLFNYAKQLFHHLAATSLFSSKKSTQDFNEKNINQGLEPGLISGRRPV